MKERTRKKANKNPNKENTKNKSKEKGKKEKQKLSYLSAGHVADALRERAEEKTTTYRVKTKNQGKHNRQTEATSTLQVAAAVCGTSSVARFSLLIIIRLVPCYPDCRLRPAFVNCAPPLGVREYETSRASSSSTHATRLRPHD